MKTLRMHDVMSPITATLKPSHTLREAEELMKEEQVRHLPILSNGGRAVGLISDRDLKLIRALHGKDDLPIDAFVEESPYSVGTDDPVRETLLEMQRKKYGCAIVENDLGAAVGIFTTTDALKAFAHFLKDKEHLPFLNYLVTNALFNP